LSESVAELSLAAEPALAFLGWLWTLATGFAFCAGVALPEFWARATPPTPSAAISDAVVATAVLLFNRSNI
jgi:hypothetical protein